MSKMKQCKACSKEIAINAKSCPGCGAKNKKPVYKRVWFWVVAVIIVAGATGTDDSKETNIKSGQEVSQNTIAENKPEDNIPTEYKSALKQAGTYSKMMHMSKAAVYNQLTSELGGQFSAEAAQYAVDNVEADWKENALESAKTYQKMMAMSPNAIYDQLTSAFVGFTEEEAQYAIDNLD